MAKLRNAAPVVETDPDDELQEVEDYYRAAIAAARPITGLRYPPVHDGPVWEWDDETGWYLPERSLGWRILAWISTRLQHDGGPFVCTPEQARFILWWFAVDERGRWVYTSGMLRRCKGAGKDPVAAILSLATVFGPSEFSHFDEDGNPVGRVPSGVAHVQVAATTKQHTRTLMSLFPALVPPETLAEFGMSVLKTNVYGRGDLAHIEAVTSNPLALEGFRPLLVIRGETQNWLASNRGHDMARAINGNAAKGEGGAARVLDICNAHRTGQDSIAEQVSDGYLQTKGDDPERAGFGLLFDTLEAPADAPLTPDAIQDVMLGVRGDSVWLDPERIEADVMSPENPASESRRKWYNAPTTAEDAWVARPAWDAAARKGEVVQPGERVYLFLDGAKSQDSTALIGCRESDGHVFAVHVWQRPEKVREWTVNRDEVDQAVMAAHSTWRVIGFWVDPSDARDTDTGERFWEPYADRWARDYGAGYELKAVTKTSDQQHAVLWDMRWPSHAATFTDAAERTVTDVAEGLLTHDGSALLSSHVYNARRRPNRWGVSLGKENRSSRRHVDAAVAMVGARMMRRLHSIYRVEVKTHDGRVW